jgi:hypothetical protein
MKKPAIFVLNAATKFSGALQNAISVKQNWIWTSFSGKTTAAPSIANNKTVDMATQDMTIK